MLCQYNIQLNALPLYRIWENAEYFSFGFIILRLNKRLVFN